MQKAVFFDKDGTIIEDVPYNVDPQKIKLYPGVAEAIKMLKEQGFKVVIVSNQSGVAYGYFSEEALELVWETLSRYMKPFDAEIDGFYYCPHHTEGKIEPYSIDCSCRKPKPGMLLQAAKDLNIDLSASWMVGDILNDIEAGNLAGCQTILINNGNETEWVLNKYRTPTYIAKTVPEAVEMILEVMIELKNDRMME